MTKTEQRLEFVKDLEPHKPDQTIALYKLDGDYVVLSTVDVSASFREADAAGRVIGSLSAMLAGTAMDGEETLAFPADASGEITNWTEIDGERGAGSREALIARLSA